MVAAAESLLGPYRWGRYDVLVLPPSFPFGGMENPRLTFATPTILAGDRSLVSLVAHELAHSWSGNLVTNATWSDFWLNEGVTSYVELRIMEALYGPERAAMLEVLARRELQNEIARLGGPTSPETILHIDLKGRNPDDGATTDSVRQGAALLRLIEQTVGRERFDAYLKGYLDRLAFQSITTATFLADLRANLIRGDAALEKTLRLDEWVYAPACPTTRPIPTSAALTRVEEAAKQFGGGAAAASIRSAFDSGTWTTQEWQHFLESLPDTLSAAQLADLDRTFGLTSRGNSEVLFAWLRIAIRHRYEPAMPVARAFLTSQGRRKFLRPLYEDLMATEWGKPIARRIYAAGQAGVSRGRDGATLDEIVRSDPTFRCRDSGRDRHLDHGGRPAADFPAAAVARIVVRGHVQDVLARLAEFRLVVAPLPLNGSPTFPPASFSNSGLGFSNVTLPGPRYFDQDSVTGGGGFRSGEPVPLEYFASSSAQTVSGSGADTEVVRVRPGFETIAIGPLNAGRPSRRTGCTGGVFPSVLLCEI